MLKFEDNKVNREKELLSYEDLKECINRKNIWIGIEKLNNKVIKVSDIYLIKGDKLEDFIFGQTSDIEEYEILILDMEDGIRVSFIYKDWIGDEYINIFKITMK